MSKSRRQGFTLIELLAATAAMAILMSAILSIISMLVRDVRRQQKTVRSNDASVVAVVEQLRLDLVNASVLPVEKAEGQIVLEGHCGIDSKTHERDLRGAKVTYGVSQMANRQVLVRAQSIQSKAGERELMQLLLLTDIASFSLAPITQTMQGNDVKTRPVGYRLKILRTAGPSIDQTLLLE